MLNVWTSYVSSEWWPAAFEHHVTVKALFQLHQRLSLRFVRINCLCVVIDPLSWICPVTASADKKNQKQVCWGAEGTQSVPQTLSGCFVVIYEAGKWSATWIWQPWGLTLFISWKRSRKELLDHNLIDDFFWKIFVFLSSKKPLEVDDWLKTDSSCSVAGLISSVCDNPLLQLHSEGRSIMFEA